MLEANNQRGFNQISKTSLLFIGMLFRYNGSIPPVSGGIVIKGGASSFVKANVTAW